MSPFPSEGESEEVPYHKSFDFKAEPTSQTFRVHQFLTGREAGGIKPIFGLTAYVSSSRVYPTTRADFNCTRSGMMIRVAMVAYGREPDFELQPPDAATTEERIAYALLKRRVFRNACDKEGIDLSVARGIVKRFEKERVEKEKRNKKKELESKL